MKGIRVSGSSVHVNTWRFGARCGVGCRFALRGAPSQPHRFGLKVELPSIGPLPLPRVRVKNMHSGFLSTSYLTQHFTEVCN